MYSGSDSTDSLKNQKWPMLNPMYPNPSNDQIDWAALAQQWIIMKEAGPPAPEITPPSPPPPPIINDNDSKQENLSEGGEAPMEVENEKEDAHSQWSNDLSQNDGSWNWNQQQQWAYSWGSTIQNNMPSKAPLLPTPGYNQYSSVIPDASTNFQYNNKTSASSEYTSGYWTSTSSKPKPHNKRYSKVNVPPKQLATSATVTADQISLDANRRKQLPAWIRDGLEKMERDKLKQLEKEKEKEKIDNRGEEIKPKFNQKEALEIIKSTVKQRDKSKFDSDEDSRDGAKTRIKKRTAPEPVMISHEELMLRIRRTMTEILLKVTNQEILAVCKEEFQRRLRKRKASDHRVSASSGNQLSARLGVGIYGESESSSGESGSDSDRDSADSEADLKAVIRRRKADFVKTEREIEERLAAAENPIDGGRTGTPDIYQSQVDTKYQDYRVKVSIPGYAISPKYSSIKHSTDKALSSISSASESDSSDKSYDQVQNRKLSNSESQRYLQDPLKINNRTETPEKNDRYKTRYGEGKYAESHSKSRRSRSKSSSPRRNRSRSRDRYQDYKSYKQYSKRSRSRSSSRSYISAESNSKKSDLYSKNTRTRKSRSRSRSRHRKSNSSERSTRQSRTSRSRQKSRSISPQDYYRRSRSRSSSRGKRSRRH